MCAIFCFETRRRFSNTASVMMIAPATAETTPATMGVESEGDRCSDAGLVVELVPKGAGVGGFVGTVRADGVQQQCRESERSGGSCRLYRRGKYGVCDQRRTMETVGKMWGKCAQCSSRSGI